MTASPCSSAGYLQIPRRGYAHVFLAVRLTLPKHYLQRSTQYAQELAVQQQQQQQAFPMPKCHPWPSHPAALKSKHKLLQTLNGIDVRRPRRRQLTRGAVRKRPRIAQSGAVAGTIGHDITAALEIGYYVVDEGVDLGLVLENNSVSLKDTRTLLRERTYGARTPTRLIVHARKLADPHFLPIRLDIILDILLRFRHIRLVDVDARHVPIGLDGALEGREEVLVVLLAHARRAEDGAFRGERGDEGLPLCGGVRGGHV